jgi:hypothetical protein
MFKRKTILLVNKVQDCVNKSNNIDFITLLFQLLLSLGYRVKEPHKSDRNSLNLI